jgi:hypothetical protein
MRNIPLIFAWSFSQSLLCPSFSSSLAFATPMAAYGKWSSIKKEDSYKIDIA